jgi:hypothetical protein
MRAVGGIFLAGALAAPIAAESAEPLPSELAQCFNYSNISAWRAYDTKTIYLRVFTNRYYRIDLARECSPLHWPDALLITHTHGSDLICSPLDLDLKASEGPGDIPDPCFVKAVTLLSPTEAAALPKGAKP